jgi:glycosyltransferase involved in cell wall biosynthesis
MVDIVMVTYNHAKYIGEAIDSVLMQECDFPFRLIIADDCSTDGTTEICEQYAAEFPERILLIKQSKNVGLVKNYESAFSTCNAEFIAILEGDDLWTDALKLQKQMDILNATPSCGLVHTAFDVLEHNGEVKRANLNISKEKVEGFLYEAVMKDEIAFCPLTVIFRRSLLAMVDYDFCIRHEVWTIDAFLWPEMAKQTEIKYIPEVTGIYRRVGSAATSTRSPEKLIWYYRTGLAMKLYYMDKYPVAGLSQENVRHVFLENLVRKLIHSGATELARKYAQDIIPKTKKAFFFKYAAMRAFLHPGFRISNEVLQLLSSLKQQLYR